jgi:hypothetical protein
MSAGPERLMRNCNTIRRTRKRRAPASWPNSQPFDRTMDFRFADAAAAQFGRRLWYPRYSRCGVTVIEM